MGTYEPPLDRLPQAEIDRQAAYWFAARRRRLMTHEERAAFETWIREPVNAAALAELDDVWLMLGEARTVRPAQDEARRTVPPNRTRQSVAPAAALSAASMVVAVMLHLDSPWWTTLDWWSR